MDNSDVYLGWRWRRKEVENYLIDPDVLRRAFAWPESESHRFKEQLRIIFDALGATTAARMAITACAPRRNRVSTTMPLGASDDAMRAALRARVSEHNESAQINEADLLDRFEDLLPACRNGGQFYVHAIDIFAGKDILARMQQTAGIRAELKNRVSLFERVLDALEHDPAPYTWLPEWEALRSAIQAWSP